jgi:hypothetical protein
LADHGFKCPGIYIFVARTCNCNNVGHITNDTFVLTMTSFLAVEFETIGLEDFDEFLESAFQAWHGAANPIGPSCPARLKTVERNNRSAHINLTKNGALRFSNCDRVGSGASMARSTYISMATPTD